MMSMSQLKTHPLHKDNPINQTILSTFMKKKKIKYDVAKNGEEAVSKWRSGGFHLILVGVHIVSGSHPCLTSLGADGHSDARYGRYTGDEGDSEIGEIERCGRFPDDASVGRPADALGGVDL